MFGKKKINIPIGEEKIIEVIESWKVTWQITDNHNNYGIVILSERCEFIIGEKQANEFANKLREAFKLLKQVGNTKVTVTKNN